MADSEKCVSEQIKQSDSCIFVCKFADSLFGVPGQEKTELEVFCNKGKWVYMSKIGDNKQQNNLFDSYGQISPQFSCVALKNDQNYCSLKEFDGSAITFKYGVKGVGTDQNVVVECNGGDKMNLHCRDKNLINSANLIVTNVKEVTDFCKDIYCSNKVLHENTGSEIVIVCPKEKNYFGDQCAIYCNTEKQVLNLLAPVTMSTVKCSEQFKWIIANDPTVDFYDISNPVRCRCFCTTLKIKIFCVTNFPN
ncbi:hypothetical protein MHBO_001026 [Bonamia ostreae]|uniref:Uncharacterized protein n=1 Tax=Bonamia ostreae TaxID=126728 RepID=A0ABV2AIU0_9EUKA